VLSSSVEEAAMELSAIPPRVRRSLLIVSLLAAAGCSVFANKTRDQAEPRRRSGEALTAAAPLTCPKPRGAGETIAKHDDAGARRAAQRGLGFVAKEAIAWQKGHNCYGCHVQAVTLEALSIGRHNQYEIDKGDLAEIVRGITEINGGSRAPNGLWQDTGKEFGGAAFARYDALVGPEVRKDLLDVAEQLGPLQNEDGSLKTSDHRFPVEIGPMQATTQAMMTWRQAYERSADEKWLAPLRKAEAWLQDRAKKLAGDPEATIVDLNYAAIGLISAGAQPTEATMSTIAARLRRMARDDGGFGFQANDPANAFATGQTLYALRLLGASDDDAVIARGTAWLLSHQADDGGWSHAGSGKAEAMWAVLGLVSIDVLSLSVGGIEDGQHVSGDLALRVRAKDNAGRGVERVEIAVDDIPVHRACGDAADYRIDTAKLESGAHLVDVTAVNARGQTSRRRYEVYAGAHYLTQVATRFTDGGTMVSLRDVAPASTRGEVALRIFATRDEGGRSVRGAEVHHESRPSAEGPMSFFWKGEDQHGRFIAEVSFVDAGKKAVQAVQVPFVHDTLDAQRAKFGEVEGTLSVDGAAPAANTKVELVDDQGRVVQSTVTTNEGNYRFRNVDGGKYKVRVSRQGFQAAEAEVHARAAAPAAAAPKMDLQRR
jgi:squalene-hopene/tetraprenyl-beta-curcumene cyclase